MKTLTALFCSSLSLPLLILVMWSCNNITQKNFIPNDNSDFIFAEQLKNRGSNDSAILFYKKYAEKSLRLNNFNEWINSISGTVDCLKAKGELDSALYLINQTQDIAILKLDTTGNLFNILIHKKATIFSAKTQFNKAEELYNRNINIYLHRSAITDTGLALSYNGLGTVYLLQNKTTEAIIEYENAIQTYIKSKHTASTDYASSLQNEGIAYSNLGNFEKAEQFLLKSLTINQKLFAPDDLKLAPIYLNLGWHYQKTRNDTKAIEYMKQAENIFSSHNQSNSINAGSLFLNMAGTYIYTAEYEKAQNYLNKSLEIISAKTPDNQLALTAIYLNMGTIAEKKEEYKIAKAFYLKGLSISDKIDNSVKLLRGLANLSVKMNNNKEADLYYKQALQKSIELHGEESTETALSYLRYGDFLSITGNSQALSYLNKSLKINLNTFGSNNIDVSSVYYFIGYCYYRAKNYTESVRYFQQSLIAGFQGFTSLNFSDNPEIPVDNLNENLLNPLIDKATALLMLYQSDNSKIEFLKSSAACFDLSLKMIEMLRSTYQDENSKLFMSENKKYTNSNALIAQVELYKITKNKETLEHAFSISEKGKSAVLLSHLRDKEAKNIGGIPEDLLAQDASLKSEIFFYNKKIHDLKTTKNPDETTIKMYNSRVFDLSRKQDELIKSIEKKYPTYYNLKYDNSVISITDIQKKLTANQAIVEFALTDTVLFSFAVTKTKTQLITTSIDSSFFKKLQIIRDQLTGKQFNNYSHSDYNAFVSTSYELYRMLILPLQPTISGKELIIIPDGELGYLSFDVLLTSLPDTSKMSYKKLPYLIRSSPLSYAPSATTFFDELNLKNNKNNGRVLAFGPDYGSDNSVLDQKDENGKLLRSSLPNLENTKEEIKSLGNYFNVKAMLGESATEKTFKRMAPEYKVLHLAMHTIINNDNPLYSKLIFFKSKGDTSEDGMLNASELINMELHADMAVLSACNTGTGKIRRGEGIMSLSRDFFYAGIPGIIMTSWAVEDRTGIKLMEYFYKYIAQGKPRNEALQLAKIEYLDNCDKLTSHPHYWASYMNVGDISPLEGFGAKSNFYWIFGSGAAGIILILIIAISTRKKRKSGNPSI
jgi:CHAT domain-containing protein